MGDRSATGEWSDERLGAVLADVGEHLELRPASARPSRIRPLLASAAALLLVVAAVVAIAPARRAVGGWLRIGRTDLRADVDLPADVDELPSIVAGLRPIARTEAQRLLGHPLPDVATSTLGAPDAWLAPRDGGVLAVWADGETTLWLLDATAGDGLMRKGVANADDVTELPELGDGGALVASEHLLVTPSGEMSAGTVVLWVDGALAFRLESFGFDADTLTAAAESLAGQ